MSIIVITGASQGIGAAIAEKMATLPNARLALVARNETNLKAVGVRCREQGAETLVLPCDVTDDTAVNAMANKVLGEWGAPDVLVNNAGVFQPGSVLETTAAIFNMQIAVNLTSAFLVTHAFLGAMIEQQRGDLFFMGSVASIRAYAGGAAYCAAKHGLLGLARVIREETKGQNLRTMILLPGATRTPSWDGVELPDERFMAPEDIAQTVFDLHQLGGRTVVEEIILRPQEGDL